MHGSTSTKGALQACGSALTEVLVAVVILSAGMVTIAGMLNESINSLSQTRHRQNAARFSADLGEVLSGLRANTTWPEITPANYHCEVAPCEPATLLAHTIYDWQQQIRRRLPGGHGAFAFVTDRGQPAIEIRIEWFSRSGSPENFVTLIPASTAAGPL